MLPTYKLTALADLLRDEGIQTSRLLQGSGLTEAALRESSTQVSYAQMRQVYENAIALTDASDVALRAGSRIHLTGTGLYGYALISSPTAGEACDFALRHYRILGSACSMQLNVGEEVVTWEFEPVLTADRSAALYRFCVELTASIVRNLFTDLFGLGFRLRQVSARYPDPGFSASYQSIFDCPVQFDGEANQLIHDAAWMDKALLYGDRMTHTMMLEQCGELLKRLGPALPGVTGKVRQILILNPGRFFTVEEMAERLAMSVRTLRRRLEAEGTTYQATVGEIKSELAMRYLTQTTMSIEEIAERVGYSESGNFRHAFKRWTGKGPGAFRR